MLIAYLSMCYLFFHFHNCFTWLVLFCFFFFTFLHALTFTYMSEFLNYAFVTFIDVFNLYRVPMICKTSCIIMCASKRPRALPSPPVTGEAVQRTAACKACCAWRVWHRHRPAHRVACVFISGLMGWEEAQRRPL